MAHTFFLPQVWCRCNAGQAPVNVFLTASLCSSLVGPQHLLSARPGSHVSLLHLFTQHAGSVLQSQLHRPWWAVQAHSRQNGPHSTPAQAMTCKDLSAFRLSADQQVADAAAAMPVVTLEHQQSQNSRSKTTQDCDSAPTQGRPPRATTFQACASIPTHHLVCPALVA